MKFSFTPRFDGRAGEKFKPTPTKKDLPEGTALIPGRLMIRRCHDDRVHVLADFVEHLAIIAEQLCLAMFSEGEGRG